MTDTSSQRAILHQGERIDRVNERIDEGFDRINARLDLLMEQASAGRNESATIVRELAGVKIDIGELRDRTARLEHETKAAVQASRDSAHTSVIAATASTETKAVAQATAQTAAKTFWSTATGRVVKWSAGVAGAGGAITAMPEIVKFLERLWGVLKGG